MLILTPKDWVVAIGRDSQTFFDDLVELAIGGGRAISNKRIRLVIRGADIGDTIGAVD